MLKMLEHNGLFLCWITPVTVIVKECCMIEDLHCIRYEAEFADANASDNTKIKLKRNSAVHGTASIPATRIRTL